MKSGALLPLVALLSAGIGHTVWAAEDAKTLGEVVVTGTREGEQLVETPAGSRTAATRTRAMPGARA